MKISHYKIVKSNKFIESRNNFSAIEHLIILLAIVQIQREDTQFHMYRIQFRDVLGQNHYSNYNFVRKILKNLIKKSINVKENNKWTTYSLICKEEAPSGLNYLEIEFHQDMQQFLLNLKSEFTSYQLSDVINFKKNYSLRIYELCKQYQKIGLREIKVEYLRNLFTLQNKYRDFNSFKVYILIPALLEINQYSDIFLDFHEIRRKNKVISIRFQILHNKVKHHQTFPYSEQVLYKKLQSPREIFQKLNFNGKNHIKANLQNKNSHEEKNAQETVINCTHSIYQKLLSFGFNITDIQNIQHTYSQKYITYILNLLQLQENIRTPKAWIRSALKRCYHRKIPYLKLKDPSKNTKE